MNTQDQSGRALDLLRKKFHAPATSGRHPEMGFPLLIRPDALHVTMQAFVNPDLAEHVVREIAKFLKKDERVQQLEIRAINQERIHNHSTFAVAASG